ncbi:MAG: carbohydrate binding family 9 domain-containing protein [bacterium]
MKPQFNLILALLVLAFNTAGLAEFKKKAKKKSKNVAFEINLKENGRAPLLDGILSKNEWRHASVVYNFTQKEPNEGQPVSEPTFILVTYDKKHIYFGIRCFDKEPDKIVSNEMRRDSDLSDNDYIEILIDTYHDQRNAYYFATNSSGARLDSEIKTEGTHINWDWDGVWYSAARKDQFGWTAEVAIPFKTLRFDKKNTQTWGINFGRYIPRKREQAYWSPITRDDDFDDSGKFKASKFGVLNGLKNIKQDQHVQIKPYSIGGVEKNYDKGTPVEKLADIGLDAKIHLTSNIVSDITLNTDFAQVEADNERVNISRFNLFFPEKRDFFLEGLDIFKIGEETTTDLFTLLFYSRQIGLHTDSESFETREVPIMGGVKMTGKEGGFELGLLNVFTNDLEYTNRYGTPRSIPKTNYSAFRLKRDIFSRSHIGVMGLSRDPVKGGNYNRTFAVDAVFAFDNNLNINGYLAKTLTPGLKGKDYNGFVNFSWGNDKFFTSASYTDIGENFNPEMGFLQWTDIRKIHGQVFISPRPKFFNLRQTHFTNDFEIITDHNNVVQYRTFNTGLVNIFQNESYFFLGYTNFYDNIPGDGFFLESAFVPAGIYNYNTFAVLYSSDLSRRFSGSITVGGGTLYDGKFATVLLANYFNPNDKFKVEANWEWNRIELPANDVSADGNFSTSILRFRTIYSFTPNLFAKAFIQWNHFDNRIIGNFLLNFIHSPGSDFYLVYNQEWNTDGKIETTNRTVLAKLTYLLNL